MASANTTLEAPVSGKPPIASEASMPPKRRPNVNPISTGKAVDRRAVGSPAAVAISPVEHLDAIGPKGRLDAYRSGALSRRERTIWACRYPEEVPVLNGEVEWIALSRADLD